MAERQTVEVWADWDSLGGARLMGSLHWTPARAKDVFSFEYAQSWLEAGVAQTLDPALRLLRGPQYPGQDRSTFGVFLDSAPDRWGQLLMQRREAQLARIEKRKPRKLSRFDFLLGVYDGHRMGALRYRFAGGPYLDDNTELASPPWTSLGELEEASRHLERGGAEKDPSYARWLRMLIAPGRSLGGARPKASVLDRQKRLWIAKFPSEHDVEDVGGWESVVHQLALRAGISTTEARRQKFGSRHHTFLARRFDRTDTGARTHFASAMTLLEREDGEEGASYLDLAQVLVQQGAHAARDLEQLWRRVLFFVLVSNVDDHLRNHGFLLEPKGWTLAPAYDMNPVATGDGLTLNISETDNAQDLSLVRDVAEHFRIKAKRANEIIAEVVAVVADWRAEAKRTGIPRDDQERMAPAFRVPEVTRPPGRSRRR